jgi:hypothetical protein
MVLAFLKVIWTALTKIPWQVYACAGVLFVGWLYGNYRESIVRTEWADSIERGKEILKELENRSPGIVTIVETKYETITKIQKEKADVIEKEIPVYIPSHNELLPGGFRLLHDAAAYSELPSQADLLLAEPVTIGEVAATVNRNYETCHKWRTELELWDEWYDRNSQLWKELQARH